MSVDFDPSDSYFTPIRGQLTSFGSQVDGKAIKRSSVTFQGNAGAGWVTINSDEYHVRRRSGYIDIRQVDDDGDLVDWQTYFDYQTAGNTAFRATYTVKSGATETTYTNESVTMSEFDPYLNSGDGGFDGELPQNLFVQEIHAEFGEIGGWLLSSTTLTSDSGNVTLDSSVPSIALGATGYQTGTGFWVGKSGGAYKLYIGDATNRQMYWDGSALTAGGFTIGADYIRDAANSFGLASTVTGGDDVRFWAGAAFASRASAPFRLTEAGVLVATSATITGSITATSGAVGGWSIAATTLSSGSISLNSSTPKITLGSVTDYLNNTGIFMGLSGGAYKFSVGTTTKYFAFDGTNPIATGQWITGAGLNPSLQDWKTNIVFSSASATQVNWTSGTIRLNDGTTYSINSGNTGAMAALTYIYLDTAVSTTVLQTTTTYSTATGSGKLLIASAQNDTVAASVIPWGGQQPLLSGGQINALSILAGNIAAGAITSTKISVSQLSAIAADMGTITAGTVTGATIRTASSGARTEMNASNLFGLGFGGVGGYDGSAVQWYAKNSDGKIYAAGGKLVMDATALALYDGSSVLSAYLVGASTTLNGESLVAGDVLFGNNTGTSPNIKISSGQISTRVDTTDKILIGGSIRCTNGSGINTNVLTVTGATGTNQDLDETGFGSGGSPFSTNFVRVTSTGNWTLRSIVIGEDGQWLFLINESANNMTISNAGAAPPGYAAIRTFDGSSPATTNAGCALFIYNDTNGTWDLMSYRG